jgi:hypothetical protein
MITLLFIGKAGPFDKTGCCKEPITAAPLVACISRFLQTPHKKSTYKFQSNNIRIQSESLNFCLTELSGTVTSISQGTKMEKGKKI